MTIVCDVKIKSNIIYVLHEAKENEIVTEIKTCTIFKQLLFFISNLLAKRNFVKIIFKSNSGAGAGPILTDITKKKTKTTKSIKDVNKLHS